MAVIKHQLTKTALPPYQVNGMTPAWTKVNIRITHLPAIGDICLLFKLPAKCFFESLTAGVIRGLMTGYTTFDGELILCDEDGGNEVVLGDLDAASLTLDVDVAALDANVLYYDASDKYVALKATTAIATADGTVEIAAKYTSGMKQFGVLS